MHVKSDQAEFRDYFRKWFVGILPALLDDTVVNHEILVLIGEQGLYKTTWFNFLLPPELRCYFYTKTNSDRLNKDDLFSLTEFALICFEELDGMAACRVEPVEANGHYALRQRAGGLRAQQGTPSAYRFVLRHGQ